MSEKKLFEGKVVVITGAGSGIGKTLALAYAKEGAAIGVVDVNEEAAQGTVKEVEALGGKAVAVKCDITKWDEVEKMASTVKEKLGNCTILLNNAGVNRFGSIANMDIDRIDWIIKVNTYAPFYCTKAFLPQMQEAKGGKIMNTSSVAGLEGFPKMSIYCMSKSALNRFTEAAGTEFIPFNIQVNAVMPTYIRTPFLMSGMKEEDAAKFDIKAPERLIPYFFFFTSSKMSGNLTGQVVNLEHFWEIEKLIQGAGDDQKKWKGFRELGKEKLSPDQFESLRKNRKLVSHLLKAL